MKYEPDECVRQLTDTIDFFKTHSGILVEEVFAEGEEDKKAEKEKEEMERDMEREEKKKEKMEGMDTMMGPMVDSPFKYEGDKYDYDTWKNFPAEILRNLIHNPYWYDRVKTEAVAWEFNLEEGPDKAYDYTHAAGLIGAAVSKVVTGSQTVWFSAWTG